MSGHSCQETCPVCTNQIDAYEDYKPFTMVSGECVTCGFTYYTKPERMTSEELNEARELYNSDHDYVLGDEEFLQPVTQKDYDSYTKKYVEVIE